MTTCYYRNGAFARTKASPCNHTAILEGKHTACCTAGEKCFPGGWCQSPGYAPGSNFIWRGGCTDKSWKDSACSTDCNDAWGAPGQEQLAWHCEGEKWCCNTGTVKPFDQRNGIENKTCCAISELTFSLDAVEYTTAKSLSTASSTSARATTSETPVSSAQGPEVLDTESAVASESVTLSSETPAATSNTVSSSDTSSSALTIGLSAALGGLGGILIALGIFFLWRRKKRQDGSLKSSSYCPSYDQTYAQHAPAYSAAKVKTPVEMAEDGARVELDAPAGKGRETVAELPGESADVRS